MGRANSQLVVIDWTAIASSKDAEQIAERMLSAPRFFADRTSISAAIDFSIAHFARTSCLLPEQCDWRPWWIRDSGSKFRGNSNRL
jgi:Protein of unknown function (DUF1194)